MKQKFSLFDISQYICDCVIHPKSKTDCCIYVCVHFFMPRKFNGRGTYNIHVIYGAEAIQVILKAVYRAAQGAA